MRENASAPKLRFFENGCISALLCMCLTIPVFIQGGYQTPIACLFGGAAAIALFASSLRRARNGNRWHSIVAPGFFLLACAYFLSLLVNSVSFTALSETGYWFAVAAVAGLATMVTSQDRARIVKVFCWVGVAASIIGILIFVGALTIVGTMDDGRLQFFFQYANTAATWFAAVALLSLLSGDTRLKAASPLPLTAALLTQSGGGILALLVAGIALCVYWWRTRCHAKILEAVCRALVAAMAFFGLLAIDGMAGLVVLACLVAFCAAFPKIDSAIEGLSHKRAACIVASAVAVLCACLAAVLLSDRLSAAGYHLIERFLHALDAGKLLMAGPALGIGPDQWQFAYPFAQSAQYHSVLVHCSYMQIAADAGLVGLALFVAIVIVGVRSAWKRGDKPAVLVTGMLALHMLVDFDAQFAAFAFLLAFLLAEPAPNASCDNPGGAHAPAHSAKHYATALPRGFAATFVVASVAALVSLLFCLAGSFADLSKQAVCVANESGNYQRAVALYSGNEFAENDIASQTEYLKAAYAMGEVNLVLEFYLDNGAASDEQAICIAMTLFQVGEPELASLALVEMMEREPFNDALYKSARVVFDQFGIHENLRDRYNAAVDNINRTSQAGWAALLHDQEYLDIYL